MYRIQSFVILLTLLQSVSVKGETISIALGSAQKDPLIDFVPPEVGDSLRTTFGRDGIRVRLVDGEKGSEKALTGFKSLLSAGGDFSVSLDFKWHGFEDSKNPSSTTLVLMVNLDDSKQTVLQHIARPTVGQPGMVSLRDKTRAVPMSVPMDRSIREGKLIIARVSGVAIFSIQDFALTGAPSGNQNAESKSSSIPIEVARFPCSLADMRGVEVWCTRKDNLKARGDLYLKKIELNSSEFFAYQTSRYSRISWQKIFIAFNALAVIGLLLAIAWRKSRAN